jgi:hypothetical protein
VIQLKSTELSWLAGLLSGKTYVGDIDRHKDWIWNSGAI